MEFPISFFPFHSPPHFRIQTLHFALHARQISSFPCRAFSKWTISRWCGWIKFSLFFHFFCVRSGPMAQLYFHFRFTRIGKTYIPSTNFSCFPWEKKMWELKSRLKAKKQHSQMDWDNITSFYFPKSRVQMHGNSVEMIYCCLRNELISTFQEARTTYNTQSKSHVSSSDWRREEGAVDFPCNNYFMLKEKKARSRREVR